MTHRVLYLPIHIPGTYHERSVTNKRGLREAFERVGEVYELDYIAYPPVDLYEHIRVLIETHWPTLIFTQLQGLEQLSVQQIRDIRRDYGIPIVNWNGDYWPEVLLSEGMIELLREVDLQLVINASVLDGYAKAGVKAAFWPFGVEPVTVPDRPENTYDVLFLGNNYSENREQLYTILRSLKLRVGVYGGGWSQADGECNYDFETGAALYASATISISDNQFPAALGYLSDRPYQAMAAGCFVLQQKVAELERWTGFMDGVHYASFDTLDSLPDAIAYWLDATHNTLRRRIADNGQAFVLAQHSFDRRVGELFDVLLPEAARR